MRDMKARLNEAADYLDASANAAELVEGRWFVDVAGPVASTAWLGPSHDVLTATWPQAALVGRFGPPTARLLAQWLRTEAKHNAGDEIHDEDCTPQECVTVAALELADQILKTKQ